MKSSRHSIHLALGTALALAAVSACSPTAPQPTSPSSLASPSSRGPSDAQAPESTGGSNSLQPGFESDHASESTGQPSAIQDAPAQPGGPPSMGQQGAGAGPQGTGPGMSQPGGQGMQPGSRGTMGGTNDQPAGINEREACEVLTSDATLHMENIEGGVAIVARPRRGVDLSKLRQDMHKVEHGIEQGAPVTAAAQCDLFALGRNGVVAVAETPDSIRLLVTTSDAARMAQIRRQAHEFVRSKGGATTPSATPKGATPHGAPHPIPPPSHLGAPPQPGGTPQHGGETPQPGAP